MICVKFTAFCDLRIRLATLRKSVHKFWFCKLALTCKYVWPGLNERDFQKTSIWFDIARKTNPYLVQFLLFTCDGKNGNNLVVH